MIRDDQVQQMQMLLMTEKKGSQVALGGSVVSRKNRGYCLSCHTEQQLEGLQNTTGESLVTIPNSSWMENVWCH